MRALNKQCGGGVIDFWGRGEPPAVAGSPLLLVTLECVPPNSTVFVVDIRNDFVFTKPGLKCELIYVL
jgi:hypothetical protein